MSFAGPIRGGASATAFEAIIKDLGVRDTIYAMGIVTASSHGADPVSRGEAEYGVAPMREALPLPGVEVTPFLPSDPRTRSTFLGGVGPKAADADGCRAFLYYLTSDAVQSIKKQHGLECARCC